MYIYVYIYTVQLYLDNKLLVGLFASFCRYLANNTKERSNFTPLLTLAYYFVWRETYFEAVAPVATKVKQAITGQVDWSMMSQRYLRLTLLLGAFGVYVLYVLPGFISSW